MLNKDKICNCIQIYVESIAGTNHTSVKYAQLHSAEQMILKHILEFTVESNHTSVRCVQFHSPWQFILKNILGFMIKKKHTILSANNYK